MAGEVCAEIHDVLAGIPPNSSVTILMDPELHAEELLCIARHQLLALLCAALQDCDHATSIADVLLPELDVQLEPLNALARYKKYVTC